MSASSTGTPIRADDRRTGRGKRCRLAWLIVAVALIPLCIKEADVLLGENFHAVAPGECYRSGQLSAAGLEAHIRDEGLKTVINLRGPNPGQAWYDDEVRVCERLGVRHIDVRLSARELPAKEQAELLLTALHDSPRPILVHCKNGADRAGLASAAYLIAERGEAADRAASDHLSLWYGHMPVGPTQAMDRFFSMYRLACSADRFHAGPSLAHWISSQYRTEEVN